LVKALLVIAALAALVAVGCGGSSTEETTTPGVTVTTESAGQPAPEIEGVTIDGDRLALSDFRGRAVLVNVWASW
jgi:hypothetical protein